MSFLPGMFPGLLMAASRLTSVTQVASATSTAATITVPATVIAGDLLVLLDSAIDIDGSAPATVIPSGFTSISNLTDTTFIRQIVSYKIADGSEASASLTGMDGASSDRKALYVMRGNVPALIATVASVSGEATGGNPTVQNVTASSGIVPLVVFGCYGSTNAVDPRTMTPSKDAEINAGTNSYLAYKIYNLSPSDVSVDMDDEGTAMVLQSFYISLA